MLYPVVLSGGFGGRLWPVSRVSLPKQFIRLTSDKTLLQETLIRLHGLQNVHAPMLVCNEQHRFIAAEQLREANIAADLIILEPVGRNTAPAAAIGALRALQHDPNALVMILPSDHVILDVASFHRVIREGSRLAAEGWLVTFGIKPTAPKTGYGYIQTGASLNGTGMAYEVDRFTEKPDIETAKNFISSSQYTWNSGIFIFRADRYLEDLKKHAPEIDKYCRLAFEKMHNDKDFSWLTIETFGLCPSDSIDYAIMEKADRAAVIPVNMGWSDVGSWGALWEVVSKDAFGNVAKGNVYMKDVNNCYIKSDKEIVATLGIDNLIIIDTPDALLIAHIDKEQEVKDVFKKLM